MESIFAFSSISSSRRVQKSSFASLSTLASHDQTYLAPATNNLQNAARVGDVLHVTELSRASLPFEMVKHIQTVFSTKECMDPISCPVTRNMTSRPGTGQDFCMYHDYLATEAVRKDNCVRFAKCSHQLSTCDPNKKKISVTSGAEPPLVRPLCDRAESGKSKSLITGPDRTESADSKTIDDIEDDFQGYDLEINRHGHVVPHFLAPPKPSKYDIYNRRRFNEDLIFDFEKW